MRPFEKTLCLGTRDLDPADDFTFDIPNEPISFLDFRFQGVMDAVVTETKLPHHILANIDRISVRYNGAEVVSLTGIELLIYSLAVQGNLPILTYHDQADNEIFTLDVRLPFSRIAYDPFECYPGTPSGNSDCRVQVIGAYTDIDDMNMTVTACRLPDATPPYFMAVDRIYRADVPIGDIETYLTVQYPYVGLLIWAEIIRTETTNTSSLDWISLFEDSDETRLHQTQFSELRQGLQELTRPYNFLRHHEHKTPVTPAVAGGLTTEELWVDNQKYHHWAYQDFDPLLDGLHILFVSRDHELKARTHATAAGDIAFYPVILRATEDLLEL